MSTIGYYTDSGTQTNVDKSVEEAEASAAAAALSEANAATSAANALTSENNAAASEAAASVSATNASLSAVAASNSEISASNSAAISTSNAASTSADAIQTSADAALTVATLDDFTGIYYGPLSADPSLDPLGNPMDTGDLYYNDVALEIRVYNGTAWISFQGDFYTKGQSDDKFLDEALNLSDLDNPTTARTNLGLGTAATVNTGTGAGDVPLNSDLGTASVVNTGTGAADVPTTAQADARYLVEANNLSDLTNDTTARTNLDVYSKSEVNGLVAGTNWVSKFTGNSSSVLNIWGKGEYKVRSASGIYYIVDSGLGVSVNANEYGGGNISGGQFLFIRPSDNNFVIAVQNITQIWKNEQ